MALPAATSVPTLKSPTGGPTNGVSARANGRGAATAMPRVTPLPRLNDSASVPKIGKPGSGPVRPNMQNASAGAKAIAAAFDTGDPAGESMTTVDAPPFNDDIQTTAEPIAAKRSYDRNAVTQPKNG